MAGGAAVTNSMTFDEAWPILQKEGIDKIIDIVEASQTHQFTSEQYMRLYTTVFNVCHPNPIGPEAKKMYDQYRKTFDDYISSKVLPSLRGKRNEDLLQELLRRWKHHQTMNKWLSRFFHYLDRYYTLRYELPSLVESSHLTFYNLVYVELNNHIRDAIISLIESEREGKEIDVGMIKEAVNIYVEIGEGCRKYYERDFEEAMMNATTAFYSRKALQWIADKSYEEYMLKFEECLNQEKIRASNYLKFRSKDKILEIVQHELLTVHSTKLEEKKHLQEAAA